MFEKKIFVKYLWHTEQDQSQGCGAGSEPVCQHFKSSTKQIIVSPNKHRY